MMSMGTLKAVVQNGRLVLDEPTGLPEGTEVELYLADEYAYLDDVDDPMANMPPEERERLHAAIEKSERELAAGKGIPAEDVLRELRSRASR